MLLDVNRAARAGVLRSVLDLGGLQSLSLLSHKAESASSLQKKQMVHMTSGTKV
jgi:hypothetical protein